MSPDVRRRVLLGLTVTLAAVGSWQFLGPADVPASVAAAARRSSATDTLVPPQNVRLTALDAPRSRPSDVARNPFVFGAREAQAESARRPVGEGPTIIQAPTPVIPTGRPTLPPIPFKYIGLVEGAAGGRIAVLSDSKGLVVHGAEGTIIDGRYKILSIGEDTIDLAYADGRGRQTLRLSGQ